ncbi:hypothetical protein A2276_06580 [candidate division WOR-1 bacterium RIFOXYA12_FULL_43_27]|uniref:DUF3084 domain-containing protein n=1 Tax=candidate division WOR-1 bacterium RIFOXYC2_FULL_46_14 TaxID=1802587 RepID=A0A1F4U5B4_UNCSA|nr:MAG: hypothetical protein A2276_06580 [candidate division WOR-1 bacterium RIFOXYA12_FULL_43_27]OGC20312.1 MAG: hypothetical protein A2292_04580 [candidate division WOR-1 bacterium RIFOXYB2_FULL_46_45]OGC31951.1 MAG: hypothetical protein A2232_06870 [candidate division WOR-1 bacterium RIFOXYA2_FULL_46_56]OGC40158.1 MAG: hypothetical protein A2438_02600 [candidate division WOR-1 bacterium RIFOXYC2_FULL_46_14]
MLAFRVIFLLIVVSGAVSYVGDKIGRYIGRRRLSLFGLRPRYTAVMVTIVSGILIATITFATFIVLSREARLALFGMEELRQKIMTLENVRNGLEKEIEVRRKGALLFRNGDIMLTTLLKGGMSRKEAAAKMVQVNSLLNLYVQKSGKVLIPADKLNRAAELLSQRSEDQVLRVKVLRNVIFGEAIPVEFIFTANKLVFQDGEEIVESKISPSLTDPEIEQELQALLSSAREIAEKKGVIPASSGSLGSIPYAEIFNTVKEIKKQRSLITVVVIASRPVYSIGPLSVSFSL